MKTYLSKLFFAAALLLPLSAFAEELKPFLTYKVGSPSTLTAVAEKIADLAGQTNDPNFQTVINTIKKTVGVDSRGFTGFALAVNEDDEIIPLLLLPITDIGNASVPEHPEVFDQFRTALKKNGKDGYILEIPFGQFGQGNALAFAAKAQKGHLVFTMKQFADRIPDNAAKLFGEQNEDIFGMTLNCENIKFEVLEKMALPLLPAIAANNPKGAELMETLIEIYRKMFSELKTLTIALNFDPKTADAVYTYNIVPRKGTQAEKFFAGFGQETTMFAGFRGKPAETVLSYNAAQKNVYDKEAAALVKSYFNTVFDGAIAQIEEDAGEDKERQEVVKLVKDSFLSAMNVIDKNLRAEKFDTALSVDVNGTLLGAGSLVETKELQGLVKMIYETIAKKASEESEFDFKKFMGKNLKKGYTTVEGFSVSSLRIPIKELPDTHVPDGLEPVLSIYWGVKENAAIAFAAGITLTAGEKTEKIEAAFKDALAGTKTAVPTTQPMMAVSVQNVGKLLQDVVAKNVEKSDPNAKNQASFIQFQKVSEVLAKADKDASAAVSAGAKGNGFELKYFVSGKVIKAITDAAKAAKAAVPTLKRETIEDF